MKEPDIYKYVWSVVKKYGFKKHNFRMFHLDNRFEIQISRGNQVGNKVFEFEFSDMSKRQPNYQWGGYISKMSLKESFNENILYSTFNTWLKSIFELDELQPYLRSLKIKKINNKFK